MTKTPSFDAATHRPGTQTDFDFPGEDAPPLEGEELCICGELEGAHQVDGFCPASGCEYFVAADAFEEPTHNDKAPDLVCRDLVVEYDAGVNPLGRAG